MEKNTSMDWIIANYENQELEAQAVQETIDACLKYKHSQQVVNDAIQSFRMVPVQEKNSAELRAKNILIAVAKEKKLKAEQKYCLVQFLVQRGFGDYAVDYSYIFDGQVA